MLKSWLSKRAPTPGAQGKDTWASSKAANVLCGDVPKASFRMLKAIFEAFLLVSTSSVPCRAFKRASLVFESGGSPWKSGLLLLLPPRLVLNSEFPHPPIRQPYILPYQRPIRKHVGLPLASLTLEGPITKGLPPGVPHLECAHLECAHHGVGLSVLYLKGGLPSTITNIDLLLHLGRFTLHRESSLCHIS